MARTRLLCEPRHLRALTCHTHNERGILESWAAESGGPERGTEWGGFAGCRDKQRGGGGAREVLLFGRSGLVGGGGAQRQRQRRRLWHWTRRRQGNPQRQASEIRIQPREETKSTPMRADSQSSHLRPHAGVISSLTFKRYHCRSSISM